MTTDDILAEREKTHGSFDKQAMLAQVLKSVVRPYSVITLASKDGTATSAQQNEAIEMILHKIARIVCGNPNHEDHWDDIAGYAMLGKRSIKK